MKSHANIDGLHDYSKQEPKSPSNLRQENSKTRGKLISKAGDEFIYNSGNTEIYAFEFRRLWSSLEKEAK